MKDITVWRMHLKPKPEQGIGLPEVLDFCREHEIIGVGWSKVTCRMEDDRALREDIAAQYPDWQSSAYKAINAMRQIKTGDLVWTRVGGEASVYYLCRVGDRLWEDREVTEEHRRHDICQFVSATWMKVGKVDNVPGKVVNSFCSPSMVQRVSDVTEISKAIWNRGSTCQKYEMRPLDSSSFWNLIDSEALECLILLYLQSRGYYIYSSTLKLSTARYEAVLVSRDGSHRAYPQVKRETPLCVSEYITDVSSTNDRIFLFTTSENYGEARHPQVECLSRQELEDFIRQSMSLLPHSITYWIDFIEQQMHA